MFLWKTNSIETALFFPELMFEQDKAVYLPVTEDEYKNYTQVWETSYRTALQFLPFCKSLFL